MTSPIGCDNEPRKFRCLLDCPQVQLLLGGFGGAYKKAASMKTTQKTQEMIYKGAGLEECDTLWASLCSLFKPSFQSVGTGMEQYLQNVLNASWLVGFDSGASFVNTYPNGLACFRLLCAGEMTWALFELRQLIPAMKVIQLKDNIGGMEDLLSFLKNLTADDAKNLAEKGCPAHYVTQSSNQILYVPVGWVGAEHCSKGVLLYGLRKTIAGQSQLASANYDLLISLFASSNKPVEKMKSTSGILTAPEAE